VNKLQEYQQLISELLTSAKVVLDNPWSLRYGHPEHVRAEIRFHIPGKKTVQEMNGEQLVRFLKERYAVHESDPQVAAILERMETERARLVAEIEAEREQERAAQEYRESVRAQFPEHIGEIALMEEILRLRNGEASTTDAALIAELRERLAALETHNEELEAQVEQLEQKVVDAERGEALAQKTTFHALKLVGDLRARVEGELNEPEVA
jgi:hypothetical protein